MLTCGAILRSAPRPLLVVPHAPVLRSAVTMSFGAVEGFTAANSAAASSADALSPMAGLLVLFIAFIAFNFATGFLKGATSALTEGDQENTLVDETLDTKRSAKDFGWIHADLRMPLPSLAELQDGCYRIGEQNDHYMYICANMGQQGLEGCEESADFSRHFGQTVYVCRGGPVQDIHGAGYRA